jgi:hypothetical protein
MTDFQMLRAITYLELRKALNYVLSVCDVGSGQRFDWVSGACCDVSNLGVDVAVRYQRPTKIFTQFGIDYSVAIAMLRILANNSANVEKRFLRWNLYAHLCTRIYLDCCHNTYENAVRRRH